MKTLKFKTNINCNGCKAAVTPFLDGDEQISSWEVDLNDPKRILTVTGADITPAGVIETLKKAGYQAEQEG